VEENRGSGKTLLERSEGGAGRWRPEVGMQRGGEVSKRGSYSAVVTDELAVEVGKSEEAL